MDKEHSKVKKKKRKIRILGKFFDVSDYFKETKDKYPIIQFAFSDNADSYLDIRLIKRSLKRGFIILTCNGGSKNLKDSLKFLIRNRKKLVKLCKKMRKLKMKRES